MKINDFIRLTVQSIQSAVDEINAVEGKVYGVSMPDLIEFDLVVHQTPSGLEVESYFQQTAMNASRMKFSINPQLTHLVTGEMVQWNNND